MVTDPSLFSVLDRVNSSSVASINLIYTDKRQLFIFLVRLRARPTEPGQSNGDSGVQYCELALYICIHVENYISRIHIYLCEFFHKLFYQMHIYYILNILVYIWYITVYLLEK